MLKTTKVFSTIFLTCFILQTAVSVQADSGLKPAYPRQCYSCEGINCQRVTKQNVTSRCTDLLDICVTIFEDATVISKGCYLDMPDHHRRKCEGHKNAECFKCFGELCNNKGREDFKCIECNDNAKCVTDTSAITPVQCSVSTAPNSYCFIRNLGGNKVQRGCYVHVQDQLKCMKDASCSMCLPNDSSACNTYTIDTSSVVSKASSVFSLITKTLHLIAGIATLILLF